MNRLPTATRVDAHCRVILEDDVTSIIHIQERHWGQMIWNTAWGRYFRLSSNSVDKRLDGGVVCWLQSLQYKRIQLALKRYVEIRFTLSYITVPQ